jgi:hypothetical protein
MVSPVRIILSKAFSPVSKRAGISPSRPALCVSSLSKSLTPDKLGKVNRLLASEEYSDRFHRYEATDGTPGALVTIFATRNKQDAGLVGDLHGNVERMDEILEEHDQDLADGRISLVFLGDLLHPERHGNKKNMDSSRELLRAAIALKYRYPEQVHFLCGNHDVILPGIKDLRQAVRIVDYLRNIKNTYENDGAVLAHLVLRMGMDESISISKKDGEKMIYQGIRFLRDMVEHHSLRGKSSRSIARMLMEYQDFFDFSPLAVMIEGCRGRTYAAHSPIIKGPLPGLMENMLINARNNGLAKQLLSNKYNEGPNAYDAPDVCRVMAKLDCSARRLNIIGAHVSKKSWAYLPFAEIPNYAIIHSNTEDTLGCVEVVDGVPRFSEIATAAQIA